MASFERHSPHTGHTVVLQSRASAVPHQTILGSKQGFIARTVGPPPVGPPRVAHGPDGPPPRARFETVHTALHHHTPGGDLLVRFGIDSILGRVVARVLMVLFVFQPVYVAMGMELDAGTMDEGQQTMEDVSVVTSTENDDESENQKSGIMNNEDDGTNDGDMVAMVVESEAVSEGAGSENQELGIMNNEDGDGVTSDDGEGQETPGDDEYPTPTLPYVGEGDDGDELTGESVQGSEDTSSPQPSLQEQSLIGPFSSCLEKGLDEPCGDVQHSLTPSEGEGDTPHPNPLPRGEGDESTTAGTTDEVLNTEEGAKDTSPPQPSPSEGEGGDVASTSDEELLEEVVPIVQNAENKYSFGEGDCTLIADGEFYCVAPTTARIADGDPRVYAEKDREGDREILYFDGVEIQRITNNAYDDFAPVFDEDTLRVVWQANIGDRMQIMVHDIPTNTTRQITSGRENSSNPDIMGDTVVWQGWVDTNWEVMMTDVDNDGGVFELERLTDNAVHDMFPQLYDGLVTWQHEKGDSWEVVVYDIRTERTHALEKNEDTKYENPRFVLLFDSKHENGDVETIGYDLDTGEMMELGTKANPQPVAPASPKEEIPDAPPQTATSSTVVKVKEGGEE